MTTNLEVTPYQALFKLVYWQQCFIASRAKVKILLNGRQTGKSSAIAALIYQHFFYEEYSNMHILYCCSTEGQAKRTMLEKLWNHHDPVFNGKDQWVDYSKGNLTFTSKYNNTKLTLAGTRNVKALVGQTINLLILDEWQDHENQQDVWTKLQPVVSATGGDVVFAGTANGYDDHYDKWLAGAVSNKGRLRNWRSWKVPTPNCGTTAGEPAAIELAQSSFSEAQYKQEYLCEPMLRSGLVYPDFDMEESVSTKYVWQDAIRLHIGLDFNKNNMNAVVCLYEDDTQHLYVVDEIQLTVNANTTTMVNEIKARYGNTPVTVYPDATGKDARSTVSWDTDHLLLEEAGFPLVFTPGNPRVKNRVNMVNGMIRSASGNRGLFIAPHCQELTKTFNKRLYDSNSKPIKDNDTDHMADALEYCVWHIYNNSGVTGLYDLDN